MLRCGWVSLLVVALGLGCEGTVGASGGGGSAPNDDGGPPGTEQDAGLAPGPDAGLGDAGPGDGGAGPGLDAGSTDGGTGPVFDAGRGDAGQPDAGAGPGPDGGADGGRGDAGPPMQPSSLFDATDGSKNYLGRALPAVRVNSPSSATVMANFPMTGSNLPRGNFYGWAYPTYSTDNGSPAYQPTLLYQQSWGCSVGGSIHIPSYAASSNGSYGTSSWDGWLVVVNTDDATVKSLWRADKSSGTWKADCGGVFPLHGNGFNRTAGVGNGAGASAGAGMVTIEELRAGRVPHALYLTSNSVAGGNAHVEPATKSDGQGDNGGHLTMGQRLYLDPAVPCQTLSGASVGEKLVCRAMQEFGAYVLDSTGCCNAGTPYWGGFIFQGDDLTDPNRQPWQRPGDGTRPGGVYEQVGLTGSSTDFQHIPWAGNVHICAQWTCE